MLSLRFGLSKWEWEWKRKTRRRQKRERGRGDLFIIDCQKNWVKLDNGSWRKDILDGLERDGRKTESKDRMFAVFCHVLVHV